MFGMRFWKRVKRRSKRNPKKSRKVRKAIDSQFHHKYRKGDVSFQEKLENSPFLAGNAFQKTVWVQAKNNQHYPFCAQQRRKETPQNPLPQNLTTGIASQRRRRIRTQIVEAIGNELVGKRRGREGRKREGEGNNGERKIAGSRAEWADRLGVRRAARRRRRGTERRGVGRKKR